MGYNKGEPQSPIIPIIIGNEEKTIALWKLLREFGTFASSIIPPAVPVGRSLIRTSYTATHTDEELQNFKSPLHPLLQRGILQDNQMVIIFFQD